MNSLQLVLAVTIPSSITIQGEKPTASWFDNHAMGGINAVKELGQDRDANSIWLFAWQVPENYLPKNIISTEQLDHDLSEFALHRTLQSAYGVWLSNSLKEVFVDNFTINIEATVKETGKARRLATTEDFQYMAMQNNNLKVSNG